jgi:tripartite-type tricarboxylate transporter receptor subunit TctC
MFFPRGTPQPIIARVHADTLRVARLPEVQQGFAAQASEVVGLGPDRFPAFIRAEAGKYARVIKLARIKVE